MEGGSELVVRRINAGTKFRVRNQIHLDSRSLNVGDFFVVIFEVSLNTKIIFVEFLYCCTYKEMGISTPQLRMLIEPNFNVSNKSVLLQILLQMLLQLLLQMLYYHKENGIEMSQRPI